MTTLREALREAVGDLLSAESRLCLEWDGDRVAIDRANRAEEHVVALIEQIPVVFEARDEEWKAS